MRSACSIRPYWEPSLCINVIIGIFDYLVGVRRQRQKGAIWTALYAQWCLVLLLLSLSSSATNYIYISEALPSETDFWRARSSEGDPENTRRRGCLSSEIPPFPRRDGFVHGLLFSSTVAVQASLVATLSPGGESLSTTGGRCPARNSRCQE